MKSLLSILLPVIFLMTISCNKDEEGSLTIHFQSVLDGEPVEMFKGIPLIDSYDIQFKHISLLVSDLQLLSASGNHYLRDVALVDMSFDDLASAEQGFALHIDGIPAETYDGISFNIGVPEDLNAMVPADFPSSSPLSKTGYYWEAWDSYIFMKIEGAIDDVEPGNFSTNFSYHTGSDDLLRTFSTENIPLQIENDKNTDLYMVFDFADILNGLDIPDNPQNHNPEDSIHIAKIVNNLQNGITLHL